MNQNRTLQRGLEQLFLAEVLTTVVGVGTLLPLGDFFLSAISLLSIGALVLMLVGLSNLRNLAQGYRLAFQLSIVELVMAFIGGLITAVLGLYVSISTMMAALALISVLALALEGAVLYLSCGATMEQIRPIADQTADQGGLVRMLVPLVVAVGVVGQALYVLPLTRGVSDFVTLLASVLQVACHACFVRFLFQCRKVVAPVAR
ncbi:hypothetical protein B5E80_00010 [Flavonifractor sp. An135]|nr:hypothetical protein [Flavonifractor sp. An135]OUQ26723.1 hypothetical protein B5E80_00010 [Flavonifractor sp. An135]